MLEQQPVIAEALRMLQAAQITPSVARLFELRDCSAAGVRELSEQLGDILQSTGHILLGLLGPNIQCCVQGAPHVPSCVCQCVSNLICLPANVFLSVKHTRTGPTFGTYAARRATQ